MKAFRAVGIAVLAVFSMGRTIAAQEKAEDLIHAALQTYASSWNSGDAHAIAELFTTDADYTGYGSVMTRGRADIQARYESLLAGAFAGTQLTAAMSSLRFVKPDVAIVDGTLDLVAPRLMVRPRRRKGSSSRS